MENHPIKKTTTPPLWIVSNSDAGVVSTKVKSWY